MKRFFITLTVLIITLPCSAIETGTVLNLETQNSYIIQLQNRPLNIENSNSKIVTVDAVTGINASDSSLLITTMEEGISYVTFKENNKEITIKLLIDNKAGADKDLLILDKPMDMKN